MARNQFWLLADFLDPVPVVLSPDLFFFIYSQTCLKQPQWVKRWSTDVAVPGSFSALDVNLSNRKRVSIAHSFSLSSYHRPDITNTVEKDVKSQVIHPRKGGCLRQVIT